MHVFELPDFLALTPQIEIIEARKPNVLACIARNFIELKYSSRKTEFDRLNYGGRIRDLGLRGDKVYVLGHDYVADHREAVPLAHFFQNREEQIAALRSPEERLSLIATPRDEVQGTLAVISL
jgi:hypothetical protein